MKYNKIKSKAQQEAINKVYIMMKRVMLTTLHVQNFPRENRLEMMRQATKTVKSDTSNAIQEKGMISINLSPQRVTRDANLNTRIVFEFKCSPFL